MAAVIRGHGTTKIVSTVNSLGKEDFVVVAICHERCAGTTSHRTGEDGRSAPLVAWDNASEPGRWQVDRFFFRQPSLETWCNQYNFRKTSWKTSAWIWVNYNDLTATSLESWLIRGIIQKLPYFRLVKIIIYPDGYLPLFFSIRVAMFVHFSMSAWPVRI